MRRWSFYVSRIQDRISGSQVSMEQSFLHRVPVKDVLQPSEWHLRSVGSLGCLQSDIDLILCVSDGAGLGQLIQGLMQAQSQMCQASDASWKEAMEVEFISPKL